MENEKLQINLAPGMEKAEVIIREVQGANELPVKPPVKLNIEGTIGAVAEFLSKRVELLDQTKCSIYVDRENMRIKLLINENDFYISDSIVGELTLHPAFKNFGINSSKVWTPIELAMFFKMNRAFFTDLKTNLELVSALKNFTATVNNKIERSAKENGDRTDNFAQVVDSNLPAAFTLNIPVFKGKPAETLEIETFAQIDGRTVSFTLLSPAANQVIEEIRDKEIDEQLLTIRELAPNIPIIEI